jgi:hypothetical protein
LRIDVGAGNVLVIEYWDLKFICNLVLEIWDFIVLAIILMQLVSKYFDVECSARH